MTRHLPHVQKQLFSLDAFIWADTPSWAHKHSCIQTTWILSQGEDSSFWCVHNSCGHLSLHISLTAALCLCRAGLHYKHLNEPLPQYSSHQCSIANLSFFLHELCNLSTWSYHTWLHLNPGLHGCLFITLQPIQQISPGVHTACPCWWPGL